MADAYIGYRSAGRRPEQYNDRIASANAPLSAVRGYLAGTAGLPGDLEGLARAGMSQVSPELLRALPGARMFGLGARADQTSSMPTSEFYNEYLPKPELNQTPTGKLFTGAGNLMGGAYSTNLARAGIKGTEGLAAMAERVLTEAPRSGSRAAQKGVIKMKGGNWLAGGESGVIKTALEEARDQILKLRALKDRGEHWLKDDKELPTRFYRGMAAMVKGGENSPKYFDELTDEYLNSLEPMSEIKSLVATERPSGALSDQINMRRANAWAASNPLTAASYATTPNSVMVPLQLKDKPSIILDAGGLRWDRYFPQTGSVSKNGNYTLNSEFRDALRNPEVKSILLKNIMDSGAGSVNELSHLYGMDITKDDLLSHNLLIKDPSVVRYDISGEVPSLKEPKVKKADGGHVAYDPDQVDRIVRGFAEGGTVRAGDGLPDPSLINLPLYARTVSEEMFPDERDNPKRDAARHMLAAAIAAQKTSPGIAEFLGKAYEFKEAPLRTAGYFLGLSEPRSDYHTDLHNNAIGVQLGKDNRTLRAMLDAVERETNRGTSKTQPGRASLRPDAVSKYAKGGSVTAYDPSRVDAILNEFM